MLSSRYTCAEIISAGMLRIFSEDKLHDEYLCNSIDWVNAGTRETLHLPENKRNSWDWIARNNEAWRTNWCKTNNNLRKNECKLQK